VPITTADSIFYESYWGDLNTNCEFYGCGIINSLGGTGGIFHKGMLLSTGSRRVYDYEQIVGQFDAMADENFPWWKDILYSGQQ
jgi:hypothetical protein